MHPIYTYIKNTLSGIYPDTETSALAKWILTELFQFSVTELYTGKDMNFPEDNRRKLEEILERLKRYEPLQYIIGEVSFAGLCLEVTPDVLIPRPETAELIDWIAADYSRGGVRILDIGTGSGCIPIALANRLPEVQVTSWDVSEKALQVAARNADKNKACVLLERVDVLSADIPSVQVDVLVSNPPYITESERAEMERNVLDWEPELALFVPDTDPLLFYRRIAEIGQQILCEGGTLYYEINRAYGPETVVLLQEMGYGQIELRKDLSGNDRMIKAVKTIL